MRRYSPHYNQIKKKIRQGKGRAAAVAEHAREQLTARYSANDYIEDGLHKLRKKTYPRSRENVLTKKAMDLVFAARRTAKARSIKALFGETGDKLGMIIVQPELFGHYRNVLKILNELGIRVVFTKNFVFSKEQAYRVFEERHLEKPTFPLTMALATSSPSKVIIFEHLSREGYLHKSKWLNHLQKTDPKEYRHVMDKLQTASRMRFFDLLIKGSHDNIEPGTIRQELSKQIVKNLGYTSQTRSREAENFDPYGAYKGKYAFIVDAALAGVHVPPETEVINHATSLLTLKDLREIKRRLKKRT